MEDKKILTIKQVERMNRFPKEKKEKTKEEFLRELDKYFPEEKIKVERIYKPDKEYDI